jgi:hypothetical protein
MYICCKFSNCTDIGVFFFPFYFHDFSVDGILVWDVHKIMASSNRLMEFWFGMCTKQWLAQTVDGILVWDVHNIMATSNRLMEFQPYSVINGISEGNTDIPTR